MDGRKICIKPWLETASLFAKVAVNLYMKKWKEDTICGPPVVVKRMLYAEWGECDDKFAWILYQNGFNPRFLDQMVDFTWQNMIKLPLPGVFVFFYDEVVTTKILEMAQGGALRK